MTYISSRRSYYLQWRCHYYEVAWYRSSCCQDTCWHCSFSRCRGKWSNKRETGEKGNLWHVIRLAMVLQVLYCWLANCWRKSRDILKMVSVLMSLLKDTVMLLVWYVMCVLDAATVNWSWHDLTGNQQGQGACYTNQQGQSRVSITMMMDNTVFYWFVNALQRVPWFIVQVCCYSHVIQVDLFAKGLFHQDGSRRCIGIGSGYP